MALHRAKNAPYLLEIILPAESSADINHLSSPETCMQSEQALQQSSVEEIFKRVPSKNFLPFQPPNFPQAPPPPPPFEALKQTYVARQEGK